MSIELIAGILLAIKIIVFAAVIIPMRKKLRFFTKNYLTTGFRLGAYRSAKIDGGLVFNLYDLLNKHLKPFTEKNPEYCRELRVNYSAVVERHVLSAIYECKTYEHVIQVDGDIKKLEEAGYYQPVYVNQMVIVKLTGIIDTYIKFFSKDGERDPIEVFNGIVKIKTEFPVSLLRDLEVKIFMKNLENKYLEQLAGSLLTNEVELATAITVADFCGTVSRDDHAEIISRIENVITPILKQNFESTVLQKYPWIEDKK